GGVGDGGARGAGRLGGEDEEQRWAVDAEGAESLDRQPLAQAQRGGYALDPLLLDPRRVCFFFQAEGGIGDWSVTGVQTCALPIFAAGTSGAVWRATSTNPAAGQTAPDVPAARKSSRAVRQRVRNRSTRSRCSGSSASPRSEERRVGKERRPRGGREQCRKEGGAQP